MILSQNYKTPVNGLPLFSQHRDKEFGRTFCRQGQLVCHASHNTTADLNNQRYCVLHEIFVSCGTAVWLCSGL